MVTVHCHEGQNEIHVPVHHICHVLEGNSEKVAKHSVAKADQRCAIWSLLDRPDVEARHSQVQKFCDQILSKCLVTEFHLCTYIIRAASLRLAFKCDLSKPCFAPATQQN